MFTNNFKIVKNGGDVAEQKRELRAYMKRRRGDNENRDVKERLLNENLFGLLEKVYSTGAWSSLTAFVYLSYSSEARTDKLVEALIEKGVRVVCPRVDGNRMEAVLYGEELALSKRGIREPVGEIYEGKIDFAVVPLLAADEKKGRLGYGGGYYDRFFQAREGMLKIGYCYDFQIVEEVPCEPRDFPLDGIVTDKRVIYS